MIYGASNSPVSVKKIPITIWALRDEIVAELKAQLSIIDQKDEQALQEVYQKLIKKFAVNQNPQGHGEEASDSPESGGEGEEQSPEENPDGEEAQAKDDSENPDDDNEEEKASEEGGEDEQAKSEAQEGGDGANGADEPNENNENSDNVVPLQNLKEGDMITRLMARQKPNMDENRFHRGTVILSDLNMTNIGFFSSNQFYPGQSIVIEFNIPNSFIVSAEVVFCRNYNLKSKVISDTRCDFRALATWTFNATGERTFLRKFVASIEPDPPKEIIVKTVKKQDDDDEEDELAELGL